MFLNKINIPEYKILRDINIVAQDKDNHRVFPIISYNGGGKSTLIQYVFGLLNFTFDSKKHTFLRNLLSYFNSTNLHQDSFKDIASFELVHNKKQHYVKFYIARNNYKNYNFDSIIKLRELKDLFNKNADSINDFEFLNRLENDYEMANLSSEVLFHEIRRFITSSKEESVIRRGDSKTIIKFIQSLKSKLEKNILSNEGIQNSIFILEAETSKLKKTLKEHNLNYIFHFNSNNYVLLVETTSDISELEQLSSMVFLASPKTQVMHFLDSEHVNSLFKIEKHFYSSYDRHITNCQDVIREYFTYDFTAINLIVQAFQKARDNDFKKALKTGIYGDEVSQSLKELNNLLDNKKITVDSSLKNLTFIGSNNNILNPSDLSHGELKKLSIYMWIKSNIPENSLVLFDEIDMGLHPKWQQDIYLDLQFWNNTNQYFIATHSPQIISNSFYKNLIVLNCDEYSSTVKQFNEAPLDSDLNSIVKTIMGAEYMPSQLIALKEKFRILFESNEENSHEAKKIKEEILMYESINSSFFQELELQRLLG